LKILPDTNMGGRAASDGTSDNRSLPADPRVPLSSPAGLLRENGKEYRIASASIIAITASAVHAIVDHAIVAGANPVLDDHRRIGPKDIGGSHNHHFLEGRELLFNCFIPHFHLHHAPPLKESGEAKAEKFRKMS
jgi:hypothetical protein